MHDDDRVQTIQSNQDSGEMARNSEVEETGDGYTCGCRRVWGVVSSDLHCTVRSVVTRLKLNSRT